MMKASLLFVIAAVCSFGQTGVYPPPSGGGGSSYYQTAEANGTAVTQRARFNFIPGSGVTITPTDNGTDTSNFTFAATGGGGSATLITQLLDLAPGTPTSTAIPFGGSCTSITPCFVHVGSTKYPFTNTATVNITSGTASDTILFYLDSLGKRTLGYNSANTYTCPNCENTPVSGISAFPANSIPIWGCTVTSGAFTASSCANGVGLLGDDRDIFGATLLSASLGISSNPINGVTYLNLAEIPRIVSGSSDTPTNADCGNQITYTNASGTTVTLPAANLGGQFLPGCVIEMRSRAGSGTVTVNPQGGSLIDGAASMTIGSGQGQRLMADNSGSPGNWQLGTGGQAGGSYLSTSGGTVTGNLSIAYAPAVAAHMLDITSTSSSVSTIIGIGQPGIWTINANSSGSSNQDFYLTDSATSVHPILIDPANDIFQTRSGFASSSNTVTFSATPTFDLAKGAGQSIAMTANVTSSTLLHLVAGAYANFQVCGAFTFTWPSNVKGGMTINSTTNAGGKCSYQPLYSFDGTNLYAMGPGTSY